MHIRDKVSVSVSVRIADIRKISIRGYIRASLQYEGQKLSLSKNRAS